MKTYLLPLLGVLLGTVVGFMVFALLFNIPLPDIFPGALLPLGLAAVASFALTRINSKKWKMQAFSVAIPTMLLGTLMLTILRREGRSDWIWLLCALAILAVCLASSWLAREK